MLVGTVHFSFRDAKGKDSHMKIRIPSSLTFAQYSAFGEASAAVVKAMTTAEITEVSVAVGLDLSGASLKTVATQFADWFNKGFFQASNAINGLIGKFIIPTWDDTNNASGSRNIDMADPDVAELEALIVNGVDVGGTIIYPVTLRNDALSQVDVAVETFRRS
jgi:hypothetical protein